jgi:cytoplasmic iron level regulating protein YaaA (DUF328/UPF0246 family)
MLYLLSPAKTLDYQTPVDPALTERATRPGFVPRSAELIEALRERTPAQIAELMSLSSPLAELNAARYAAWRPRFTARNSRPALTAFDGEVYAGLDAKTLSVEQFEWAQDHLVILSGLYGALRPLDLMQPYRLEMGTRLPTAGAKDLYGFWGDALATYLNRRQRGAVERIVVNLASQEYFRAADRPALKARVIDCVFEDWSDGGYKVIGFFAKRARGLMARFAIEHRIAAPDALDAFDAVGYRLAPEVSSADRRVFRRRLPESGS